MLLSIMLRTATNRLFPKRNSRRHRQNLKDVQVCAGILKRGGVPIQVSMLFPGGFSVKTVVRSLEETGNEGLGKGRV